MKKIQIIMIIELLIKLPKTKPTGKTEIKKMFKFCMFKTLK